MKRRTLLRAGLAAAVVPWAAACSRGEANSPSESAGPPRPGGSLVVALPAEISTNINPLSTNDPSAMGIVSGTVYSKLLEFATGPDVEGLEIVGDLAESWEVSDDGLEYVFHLRDDVRWHDVAPVSGRPFVADDVVATFTALKDAEAGHVWMIDPVETITAPDDHTVVFTLSHSYSPLLEYLAYHFNMVMPREGVEGAYDVDTEAIGTGPFILESHRPDIEWVLVKNPDYFIPDRPYVDEIRRPVMTDVAAVTAALRSGRLDAGTTTDVNVAEEFEGRSGFRVESSPGAQVSFYLNPEREPFDDLRVRQAIMMAIDWVGMGENIRGTYNLTSILRPDTSDAALTHDEVMELRPYDPDRARELLAEAGLPDGFSTSLVVQRIDDEDVREAQWMQADLREIGVEVEIETVDPATGIQRRVDHEFEMTKALRGVHLPDQVWQDFIPDNVNNYALVEDPQLTEMIGQSRAEYDTEARAGLYQEMQERMETEIVQGFLPIQTFVHAITNERVQDLWPSPIYQGKRLADVWLRDA